MTQPMTGSLTGEQVSRLLTPVRGDRIEKKQGMSYVPQQEVRAELIRVFGPGRWDSTVHDVALLYEGQNDQKRWVVCYRVACTLRVRDFNGDPIAEFTEYHIEENAPQPNRGEAHVLALTSAESYALRRAAIGLGDAFGLHLYDKGRVTPLVRGSLIQAHIGGGEKEEKDAARQEREAKLASTVGAASKDEPEQEQKDDAPK